MVQFAADMSAERRHLGVDLNLRAVSGTRRASPRLPEIRNVDWFVLATATGKGDLVPGAAEERANFIRAVTVGLNDLETGRDVSFDDAAIRLGLDRNEVPSRPIVGAGHSSPVGD